MANSDFGLILGDLSKNSETALGISELIANSGSTPILLVRDSIDLVANESLNIIMKENLFIFASLAQLQKIFRALYYPKMLLLSQPLLPVIETLHKFTLSYPVSILTFHEGHFIAAQNGKVWKATLKKGLKWSDGADISNEDVMFTIDLIQNPLVNSIYSSSLKGVKVEEDENGHIIFTLPSAYADFASALEFPIVPKHELEDTQPQTLVEDDFSNAPVVSGPFMFNALQTGAGNNVTVFLSANPNYYRGKPMLNSFAVHTYDDKASVISALNSGAVTATAELAGSEASEVTSTSYVRQDSGINSGAFMFFNTSSDVVKKREMRTAIRQGIDLITVRTAAPGTVMLDYPLIESQIKLTTYQKIPKYNFDAAKEKIATLSAGKELVLNVATVNSGYLPAVTDALKTQLELLGFNVNVTVYEETQEFIGNIIAKRNYDILVYEIELGADPDLLPYYHSSQANTAGLNLSNYRNALADDLLIGARETLDETMRILKYETFLQHWVYDVPAIGLYQANMTYLYNKNARAFSNNVRLVTPIDRFSDVMNFAATKATKNKTP